MQNSIKLWHATRSGKAGETVRSLHSGLSLKKEFARFSFIGQTPGVFIWSNRDAAQLYAVEQCNDLKGDPLIAETDVQINPQEWDFDYELGIKAIIEAFQSMEDEILKTDFSDLEFKTPGMYDGISKLRDIGKTEEGLYFSFSDTVLEKNWTIELKYGANPFVIFGHAQILQKIGDKIRQTSPETFNRVLKQSMEKSVSQEEPCAFKYISEVPLKISAALVKNDGKWISLSL